MNSKELKLLVTKIIKGQGTVIPLSACRNLILRHPIAVSGETTTCAQVVAKRANTVGLLLVRILSSHPRDPGSSPDNGTNLLGNRADPGLILLCRTNKRPTMLALSETTCPQVVVSPETAMGCHRIRFLQAKRDITVP